MAKLSTVLTLLVVLVTVSPSFAATAPVAPRTLSAPQCGADLAMSQPPERKAGLPDRTPEPLFLTGCTAQQGCPSVPSGSSVSCSGVSSCTVGVAWVSCDGQTTYCGCYQPQCNDPYCNCQCVIDFPSDGGRRFKCAKECYFAC